MWPKTVADKIAWADRNIVCEVGPRFGLAYAFAELEKRQRLAWVYPTPPDSIDAISQGNLLARAVNSALGAAFLPLALPFGYQIRILKEHETVLRDLYVAVSQAKMVPALAEALLELPNSCCVILDWEGPFNLRTGPVLTWSQQDLGLSLEAAREEAPQLDATALRTLWSVSEGAYADFLAGHSRLKRETPPNIPTPTGYLRPRDEEILVDPTIFLDVLLFQDRPLEALDVACRHVPHRVEEIISVSGPSHQEQGLLERLYLNLRSLDDDYLKSEAVLEWLLVAALGVGRLESVIGYIEAYLENHDAPTLRARYVGLLRTPDAALEAKRLARDKPTPLSLFQWGRLHPDPQCGVDILMESVELAEKSGSIYAAIRNAGALAARLLHTGAFKKALSWSEWALRQFDAHDLSDGQRRLRLTNDWAFARIVTGQTVGLRASLWELQHALESSLPDLAMFYRSTLAELELLEGNLDEAASLARSNVWQASRQSYGKYAVTLVRVLLEQNALDEALREARIAYNLEGSSAAALALGMALSAAQSSEANSYLETAMNDRHEPAERRCAAALYFLKHNAYPFSDLDPEVRALFRDISRSGLIVFSGPEKHFSAVWGQVHDRTESLRINLFGRPEVRYQGDLVKLSPTLMELVAILAFQQAAKGPRAEGLPLEALADLVYREAALNHLTALKMNLSRLRKKLGVLSQAPYKLDIAMSLDALEFETLLADAKTREALTLYKGPLMPTSDIPYLSERRDYYEELAKKMVMASHDLELLYAWARDHEDIDIWELTKELLTKAKDPRAAIAEATLRQLYKQLEDLD